MKKSAMVTLVLSSRLVTGCDDAPIGADWNTQGGTNATVTNNTYVRGWGYYHAPYYGWYEYPYNYYRPGWGYYHGGAYTLEPEVGRITASRPAATARPFSGGTSSAARTGAAGHAAGISRGGFGFSARGGS